MTRFTALRKGVTQGEQPGWGRFDRDILCPQEL